MESDRWVDGNAYAPGVIGRLRPAQELPLPTGVRGELLAGCEAWQHSRQSREQLALFRGSPRARLAPIGEATAERYAVIYASLRSRGRPIPTNDLWIAASAMEHATDLLTLGRDFTHVPQIMGALYE